MANLTQELLFTFLALIDYFYVNLKETELINKANKIMDSTKIEQKIQLLLIKELLALLGNLIANEVDVSVFYKKNLHLIILDIIISFINYPKLIKICIGALINLTNNDEIRENLANIAVFIKSLYLILETYKDNSAIISYLLKLMVNVMKNGM